MTADGNYDMTAKKLTNVGAPTDDKDAATKKYVDDNVTFWWRWSTRHIQISS